MVTEPGHEREIEDLAALAKGRYIVEDALRTPVRLRLEVDVAPAAVAAA